MSWLIAHSRGCTSTPRVAVDGEMEENEGKAVVQRCCFLAVSSRNVTAKAYRCLQSTFMSSQYSLRVCCIASSALSWSICCPAPRLSLASSQIFKREASEDKDSRVSHGPGHSTDIDRHALTLLLEFTSQMTLHEGGLAYITQFSLSPSSSS